MDATAINPSVLSAAADAVVSATRAETAEAAAADAAAAIVAVATAADDTTVLGTIALHGVGAAACAVDAENTAAVDVATVNALA